jgi:TetR/AcrR family transcriptional repressor of uid operon
MTAQGGTSVRDARRLRTRERILGAAVAEFKQSGMAGAEVSEIVAAAGVAHGTFYFHFPTKEHVLREVERREERRIATQLAHFLEEHSLDQPHDLAEALTCVVDLVTGLEQRLGSLLFKEFLALHFSPSRPERDDWTDHPVIVLLVRQIEQERSHGAVHPEVDAFYSAIFFLLGVYGVLTTTDAVESRTTVLNKLIASALRGLAVSR